MNTSDNYKLIGFIKEHGINVVSCSADSITCETVFSKDGKSFTENETIQASMPAVRDYLGY